MLSHGIARYRHANRDFRIRRLRELSTRWNFLVQFQHHVMATLAKVTSKTR
jgi:hypothetical protein